MDKLQELLDLNVNKFTEKKNGLTYLSWSHAWKEFIKVYPNATYKILKGDDGLPCFGNDVIGFTCYTEVTVGDITHEMWLPVMDGANKSMKTKSYKYKTKYGEKEVQPMTMFDVNKTVMRCLTKNLAMFGLGLYIYAGEDLPETPQIQPQEPNLKQQIFNVLKLPQVPEADRNKWIEGLKSGEKPISNETLDQLIALYGAK